MEEDNKPQDNIEKSTAYGRTYEPNKELVQYKTPNSTYWLMIGASLAAILFGLVAKIAIGASSPVVDNSTQSEVKLSVNNIIQKIDDQNEKAPSILVSGEIATKEYAETLNTSAYAILNCARKIDSQFSYERMTDLGEGLIKVELLTDDEDEIRLIMKNEDGWKIDSAICT